MKLTKMKEIRKITQEKQSIKQHAGGAGVF